MRRKTAFAVALTGVFVLGTGLKLNPSKRCFRFGCHVFVNNLLHLAVLEDCHQASRCRCCIVCRANLYQHIHQTRDLHKVFCLWFHSIHSDQVSVARSFWQLCNYDCILCHTFGNGAHNHNRFHLYCLHSTSYQSLIKVCAGYKVYNT